MPAKFYPPITVDSTEIEDATAVGRSVITATDAAAARTAIGAGTSNLALGTTNTTAKAGDYAPAWNDVTSKPTTFTPATHNHAGSEITTGTLPLDRIASYGVLKVPVFCSASETVRPTVPAGMQLVVVGGTSAVSWLIAGDLQLLTP